jgi:POT family proton-dependent oligopeptide transporter
VTGATLAADEKTWFGQPRGLTILFLTNMWEQFSYFGMRALLMYYMTKQLLIGQAHASNIYGVYIACAYFTPVVGGVVADRLLGKRRAVILGASIMAAGHFMMTFEPLLYVALATIALGNGLFLPSLPSQINDLYAPGDPRRAWAYNVYYVGINIGGFLAPLLCGTIGEAYGWHYGFGLAGIGMVVGLVTYLAGQHYLPTPAAAPVAAAEQRAAATIDGRATARALAAIALCVIIFRGAYEQVGNALALWIDQGVDRAVGQFVVPMTWFQSLNPLIVIFFTPVLLAFWQRRAAAGHDQSPARRMALGAAITAGAFAMLAGVAWSAGAGQAAWPWLVLFFLIYTVGELHILPSGLGLFARLAPPRLGATTVASWYVTISAGSLFAGKIGALWSDMTPAAFFLLLASLAAVAAILLRSLDAAVRRVDPVGT